MRARHIVTGLVYGVGAIMGLVGLYWAQAGTDVVRASELLIGAIAFMAGGVVCVMAMDDPQSRSQMEPDGRIDLGRKPVEAQPRQPVHA
jgi:hypothetical protein